VVVSNALRRCEVHRRVRRHRVYGKRRNSLAQRMKVAKPATGNNRTTAAPAATEDCTAVAIAAVKVEGKLRGRRRPPLGRACMTEHPGGCERLVKGAMKGAGSRGVGAAGGCTRQGDSRIKDREGSRQRIDTRRSRTINVRGSHWSERRSSVVRVTGSSGGHPIIKRRSRRVGSVISADRRTASCEGF